MRTVPITESDEVAAYLRDRRGKVALDTVSLMLGLSAISTGLDQIARGRVDEGRGVAAHGLDFIRNKIDEAKS